MIIGKKSKLIGKLPRQPEFGQTRSWREKNKEK
jgi:hypothetical protein